LAPRVGVVRIRIAFSEYRDASLIAALQNGETLQSVGRNPFGRRWTQSAKFLYRDPDRGAAIPTVCLNVGIPYDRVDLGGCDASLLRPHHRVTSTNHACHAALSMAQIN
jgi:hypothetical protein